MYLATFLLGPAIAVTQSRLDLRVDNGAIRLRVDRRSGFVDFEWGSTASLNHVFGETKVGGVVRRTTGYTRHEASVSRVSDAFGRGVRVVVRHRGGPLELRQSFWVYEGRAEALVKLEAVGRQVSTNYLAPVVGSSRLLHRGDLHSLFVPYDNDNYFRFDSEGWNGSHELGALYEDETRRGLVIGSVEHDLWKSSVLFTKTGGVRAFAGSVDKFTHDSQPHGVVTGSVVGSPRMAIGLYDDWRAGLERFADINAVVKPALAWKGGVPFGWNSWSAHKDKVKASDARVATDFLSSELITFRNGGTAYVNFDSFWTNLKEEELAAFVTHAHASGLKAGIYWTPFACWSKLDDLVDGQNKLRFREIVLKDDAGVPLPKIDNAYPIDPTHPEALARVDRELGRFARLGFEFVKLDFLTLGALEGRHSDRSVQTGTAAYNLGMKRIVKDIAPSRMFISLSIAPLFPHGYAHSRRISCDVFANIGASEYLLNSTNYGWWPGGRLYAFNDPDSSCVYRPSGEGVVSEAEARTRVTASVISGGMMILGDDMTQVAGRARVLKLFSNSKVLDLARRTPRFWPVEGGIGSKGGDSFVWRDGASVYVALFNFSKTADRVGDLPLARLGLGTGSWKVHDLWTGQESSGLSYRLAPMDCALLRLSPSA